MTSTLTENAPYRHPCRVPIAKLAMSPRIVTFSELSSKGDQLYKDDHNNKYYYKNNHNEDDHNTDNQ